ncbi:hypothetical protein B0H19DRAFT_372831 [Mycena capillaripes]|nr:hypothetical protein B0H19DRAFT_372831 [Mycena capillaripes]
MSSSSSKHHLLALVNDVTLGVSIPGVALSILLLAGIAYLQWHPVSRPHLDRVSFRLLVYALVANLVFGTMMFPDMKETTPGCSFVAFLGVTSPLFSATIFCCMALNLLLVLVCGVNGNKMEKYYIIGAILLCAACTVPAWAAGELGWYATNGSCWLRDPTPTAQLHWLIGTQSIPMLFMSTVEVFSFVTILIFMVRHQWSLHRLRADTTCHSICSSPDAECGIPTLVSSLPKHPVVTYRPMILRIALYPLLSCFLSVTACILDVYSVTHPNLTDFDMNMRVLNLCVYSFRPLLYALLAVTDPSFLRAIRALRPKHSSSSSQSQYTPSWTPWSQTQSQSQSQTQTATMQLDLELPGKRSRTNSGVTQETFTTEVEDRLPQRSMAEEALAEEELRSEKIGYQI